MENIVHLKEPVFHEFDYDEEIAGSLKSIDLNIKYYKNEEILEKLIKKYIDELYNFNGKFLGDIEIFPEQIQRKVLHMIVPNIKLSDSQIKAINSALDYAESKDIYLNIIVGID